MFVGTQRFRILECLGKGGMGVVYRVRDEEMQRDVALKTLRRLSSDDLYQIKGEFRALAGIVHPNLVELHELFVDGDQACFTMEVVDGQGLLDHLWAAEGADGGPGLSAEGVARLEAALPQLVAGISALHGAGRLHRDIKPSNVMVDWDGRVVLLDFGLATAWGDGASADESPSGATTGTGPYMSPEQIEALPLGPSSDWFSLGVLLYEAVTGRLPFAPQRATALVQQRERSFPRPGELHPSVPSRLDRLIVDLLHPDASKRPDGREILRRLRDAPASTPPERQSVHPDSQPFVGRVAELSALRRARSDVREGALRVVRVEARSGMGKSELVRRFLAEVERDPTALVLQGRCLPQESVAYKAFDGLIDALSRHVVRHPGLLDALSAPLRQGLLRLFPVLGRAVATGGGDADDSAPDPRAVRDRGFEGLRSLLSAVGRVRPLVLWIDDIQWADTDSVAMARALLSPPDVPPLLLVVSYQSELRDDSPMVLALDALEKTSAPGTLSSVLLGPLPADDAHELALRLLGPQPPSGHSRAEALASESAGSPFFVIELARTVHESPGDATPRLEDVLRRRIAAVTPDERRLLSVVAVAGRPVERRHLLRASALGESGRREVSRLVGMSFLRLARIDGQPGVETRHERMRAAILEATPEDERRRGHLGLAEALIDAGAVDLDALVHHLAAAGDRPRAARYSLAAGDRAAEVLAFERAVAHYRRALEVEHPGTSRAEILQRLASALVSAGRGAEAAEAFMESATAVERARRGDATVIDLRRKAAAQYVCSGRYGEGLRVMREVLSAVGVGLPASARRATLSGLAGRVRFLVRGTRGPKTARALEPAALQRLDALWSAVVSLSMVQPAQADALAVQHLLETLERGDPSRVVRAVGYEATCEASVGGGFFRRRARALLVEAEEIAASTGVPYDRAWVTMARGTTAWFESRWSEAFSACDAAVAVYTASCRGVAWEQATSEIYALSSLALMGRLRELGQRLPRSLREAESRDDHFAAGGYCQGEQAIHWLAEDRVDEWRAQAAKARALWLPGAWHLQRYQHLVASIQAELYEAKGAAAFERAMAEWPELESAQLLRLECARVEMLQLRGRAALAAARGGTAQPRGWTREKLHAQVLDDARRIAESELVWAAPLATMLRGGVALQRGEVNVALKVLGVAEEGFARAEMHLHRAALRRRVGELVGGDGGRQRREASAAWMRDEGVRRPDALADCVFPA